MLFFNKKVSVFGYFIDFLFGKIFFNYLLFTLIFSILVLFSCKTTNMGTPTQKKEQAEKIVQLARSVNAEEYAPEDFDIAVSSLNAGNDLISEDNSSDNAIAYSNYVVSIEYASNAYEKSVGPYVQNLISETDQIIDEAQGKLHNIPQFKTAVELNQESWEEYDAGNYLLAKEKTLEARDAIEEAYIYAEETDGIAYDKRSLLEGESIYTVINNPEDRDCLWKIADRKLGSPLLWPKLYQRNDDIISNPNLIYPGQQLILPNIRK